MHAAERAPLAAPEALYAVAFLAPWGLLSLFLAEPYRALSFGLLALLIVLLAAAGAWARRAADLEGLDGARWGFATVVSLGLALAVLLVWKPEPGEGRALYRCAGCGRLGELHEPFCFGCGAR